MVPACDSTRPFVTANPIPSPFEAGANFYAETHCCIRYLVVRRRSSLCFRRVKSTQDRSEGGLGIGLALAKGLIHLHRGTLEVRSEGPGLGSEFIVNLPRTMLSAPTHEPASPTSALQVSRRILIADDNKDAADSLAILLRMDGHDIVVVHDGRLAMSTIESFRPEIALLDVGMPGLDGYEVARHVRQCPLGTMITLIAVTGWGQASDKARATAAGFDHHFTEPVEPEALIRMLRGVRF